MQYLLFETDFYLILLAVNSLEVAKMQPAPTPASASPAPCLPCLPCLPSLPSCHNPAYPCLPLPTLTYPCLPLPTLAYPCPACYCCYCCYCCCWPAAAAGLLLACCCCCAGLLLLRLRLPNFQKAWFATITLLRVIPTMTFQNSLLTPLLSEAFVTGLLPN